MSDRELGCLANALRAETPTPNAEKKADVIAQAMKNFDTAQGSQDPSRQTSDSSKRTGFRGVFDMIRNWKTWSALAASTAVAVVVGLTYLPIEQNSRGVGQYENTPHETAASNAKMPIIDPELGDPEMVLKPSEKIDPEMVIEPDYGIAGGATFRKKDGADEGFLFGRKIELNETYSNADPNPIKITAEQPVSTFSIDVDTASWSMIRNSILDRGQLPSKDAVRIEEMMNYFTYDYPDPTDDAPFSVSYNMAPAPWNTDKRLITIRLQGVKPQARVPLNLVFLIDTSGSMNDPKKLPLLRQSFRLLLGQLAPEDEIAIVTYAGAAGVVLEPTKAAERTAILIALDGLTPGGSTAGEAGLQQAYDLAETMQADGEVTRVLLATDGDFNLGISDPEALTDYVADKRDTGTYLSVLGFGRGNLNDAIMQALAQNGNGMATYIDTVSEAQKVLIDQMQGTLFPIAEDVKIQVEFNPSKVAEYRLLGYETRALDRADFNNDNVDAGEIGAGHQVTAIYEVTPVGSPARLTDPLRYDAETVVDASDELCFLRLRYKTPGEDVSQLIETTLTDQDGQTGFAAAIAGFGELLRGSDLIGDWSYEDAIALAQADRGEDPFGYRQEAIRLMQLAQSLSQ